jgi:hypothetical protein
MSLRQSPGEVPRRGWAVLFGVIRHRPPPRVAVMYCSPSLPFR